MTKFRKHMITTMLAALAMVALYGCGAEPTATPAPPTDTPAPPTAAPTDTPVAAEPAATSASTSGNVGSAGGAGMGTGTLTGPVADQLAKSQQAMEGLKSYHFTMNVEQPGVGTAVMGEGDYMAPDSIRMQMGGMMGMTGTIETIILGEDMYMKQPGTDQYMMLSGAGAGGMGGMGALDNLNSATAFSKYAESGEIVGDETLDGVETTHINFVYDADKAMGAVTSDPPQGAAAAGKSTVDMWIDKKTNYPHKVVVLSKTANPDPMAAQGSTIDSTVTILYSKINEPVSPPIEKPTDVITMPGMMEGLPPGMPPGGPGGLPPGLETPVVPGEMGTPVP